MVLWFRMLLSHSEEITHTFFKRRYWIKYLNTCETRQISTNYWRWGLASRSGSLNPCGTHWSCCVTDAVMRGRIQCSGRDSNSGRPHWRPPRSYSSSGSLITHGCFAYRVATGWFGMTYWKGSGRLTDWGIPWQIKHRVVGLHTSGLKYFIRFSTLSKLNV